MKELKDVIKKCTCCDTKNILCHLNIETVSCSPCVRDDKRLAVWYNCINCGSTQLTPMSIEYKQELEAFCKGGCNNAENCGKCKK